MRIEGALTTTTWTWLLACVGSGPCRFTTRWNCAKGGRFFGFRAVIDSGNLEGETKEQDLCRVCDVILLVFGLGVCGSF